MDTIWWNICKAFNHGLCGLNVVLFVGNCAFVYKQSKTENRPFMNKHWTTYDKTKYNQTLSCLSFFPFLISYNKF